MGSSLVQSLNVSLFIHQHLWVKVNVILTKKMDYPSISTKSLYQPTQYYSPDSHSFRWQRRLDNIAPSNLSFILSQAKTWVSLRKFGANVSLPINHHWFGEISTKNFHLMRTSRLEAATFLLFETRARNLKKY